jgi:DNA-binding response OmpR family regulator
MNKRLLVIDDEPKLLSAVAVDLRAEGYEVTWHDAISEMKENIAQKAYFLRPSNYVVCKKI